MKTAVLIFTLTALIGLSSQLTFDFESDRNGWVLGSSGDSHWQRQEHCSDTSRPQVLCDEPDVENWGLYIVRDHAHHAGTTPIRSPLLELTDETTVTMMYWMKGQTNYTTELRIWKRQGGSLTLLGDVNDQGGAIGTDWMSVTFDVKEAVAGDQINIEIDGFLSVGQGNQIGVASVDIPNVNDITPSQSLSFDFENDDGDWEIGNHNGATWARISHTDEGGALGVPAPGAGDYYMMIHRCDPMAPGIMSIESPPITAGDYTLDLDFFITGSADMPADMTLRYKTASGTYDVLPFHTSRPQGMLANTAWEHISTNIESATEDFQLVIEGYLGSSSDNMLAVDNVVFGAP